MSSTDLADLDIDPSELQLPQFAPDELLGQSFVRTMDDGRNVCTKILSKIQDLDTKRVLMSSSLLNFMMLRLMKLFFTKC
jgi:hypothetical protein